ncbi:MAG: hypothetical protein OEX10_09490 [Candidatus Bathyarchaeota archaeon]|nr:hypothetical protein [Candidatus Bathyarchaeota archaeon]
MDKLKKATGSYWARSKAFRIIITVVFLVLIGVPIFLLYWYARILLGNVFDILIIIAILVFGYVTRKKGGYVEQVSPKVRRLQCVVSGGLLTGFAILTTLRVLFGPLPYPHSFLLFLILIAVGAYIGNTVGRKLRWY